MKQLLILRLFVIIPLLWSIARSVDDVWVEWAERAYAICLKEGVHEWQCERVMDVVEDVCVEETMFLARIGDSEGIIEKMSRLALSRPFKIGMESKIRTLVSFAGSGKRKDAELTKSFREMVRLWFMDLASGNTETWIAQMVQRQNIPLEEIGPLIKDMWDAETDTFRVEDDHLEGLDYEEEFDAVLSNPAENEGKCDEL